MLDKIEEMGDLGTIPKRSPLLRQIRWLKKSRRGTVVEEVLMAEPVLEDLLAEEPVIEDTLIEDTLIEDTAAEEIVIEEPTVEEPWQRQ